MGVEGRFGGLNQGFAGAGFGGFPGAYGGYGGCAAWLAGRVARRQGTGCGVVGAGRALPQCGAGRPF